MVQNHFIRGLQQQLVKPDAFNSFFDAEFISDILKIE